MRTAPQRGLRLAKFSFSCFFSCASVRQNQRAAVAIPLKQFTGRPRWTSPSASALPYRYDPERPEPARGVPRTVETAGEALNLYPSVGAAGCLAIRPVDNRLGDATCWAYWVTRRERRGAGEILRLDPRRTPTAQA